MILDKITNSPINILHDIWLRRAKLIVITDSPKIRSKWQLPVVLRTLRGCLL